MPPHLTLYCPGGTLEYGFIPSEAPGVTPDRGVLKFKYSTASMSGASPTSPMLMLALPHQVPIIMRADAPAELAGALGQPVTMTPVTMVHLRGILQVGNCCCHWPLDGQGPQTQAQTQSRIDSAQPSSQQLTTIILASCTHGAWNHGLAMSVR